MHLSNPGPKVDAAKLRRAQDNQEENWEEHEPFQPTTTLLGLGAPPARRR